MASTAGRRWVLAARPQGIPDETTFRLEDVDVPDPGEGEVRVRVTHFSLDPGMRPALSRDTYTAATPVGGLITSAGLGVVEASGHERFREGDIVTGGFGWQSHAVVPVRMCVKHDRELFTDGVTPTAAIGILGVPGMTAWVGLKTIAPMKEGETVLISSASGPVGATAGQLARLFGAGRVAGIAGSIEKCAWLEKEARFDVTINYRETDDLAKAMRAACPDGVDVYFDNVGGEMLDTAIATMNQNGRIAISGQLAEYNRETPRGIRNTLDFITRRLNMAGFVVLDHVRDFHEAQQQMAAWIRSGDLIFREEVIDGIENAPAAFAGLFTGENFGRRLIKVSDAA